jgi:hypothetical protein
LLLVADLPATVTREGIEIVGRFNRVDTPLIIDTGAELTVLTSATVNHFSSPEADR